MKRIILTGILALAAGAIGLAQQGRPAQQAQPAGQAAQKGQAAPPAQPAQPGPRPKSAEEAKAVQAVLTAQQQNDLDGIIKAADTLLTTYADTDYKEMALTFEAMAYEMKGDPTNAQVAWERVLATNAKSIQANVKLAGLIVTQTNSKALDRDEKLAQAEKYLKATQDLIAGPKPNPQLSDQDWDGVKLSLSAEVHNDYGMAALIRADVDKNAPNRYDKAITEFQTAAKEDPSQPTYAARLASTYLSAGKNAEAIAQCDTILATPNLLPQIKDFVTKVKTAAQQAGAAK